VTKIGDFEWAVLGILVIIWANTMAVYGVLSGDEYLVPLSIIAGYGWGIGAMAYFILWDQQIPYLSGESA